MNSQQDKWYVSKATPSNQAPTEGHDLRDYLNDRRGQEQPVLEEV